MRGVRVIDSKLIAACLLPQNCLVVTLDVLPGQGSPLLRSEGQGKKANKGCHFFNPFNATFHPYPCATSQPSLYHMTYILVFLGLYVLQYLLSVLQPTFSSEGPPRSLLWSPRSRCVCSGFLPLPFCIPYCAFNLYAKGTRAVSASVGCGSDCPECAPSPKILG